MIVLLILSYLAGVLTIISPCILPVLPFVFARSDQPFLRSGLPLLLGMAATFAGVATLAAVGGGWAVQANNAGRLAALVILGLFGLLLLLPSLVTGQLGHSSASVIGSRAPPVLTGQKEVGSSLLSYLVSPRACFGLHAPALFLDWC